MVSRFDGSNAASRTDPGQAPRNRGGDDCMPAERARAGPGRQAPGRHAYEQRSDDRFIQSSPREGQPPTERTELWVAYDDRALYVAFRCHGDPSQVVARLT